MDADSSDDLAQFCVILAAKDSLFGPLRAIHGSLLISRVYNLPF